MHFASSRLRGGNTVGIALVCGKPSLDPLITVNSIARSHRIFLLPIGLFLRYFWFVKTSPSGHSPQQFFSHLDQWQGRNAARTPGKAVGDTHQGMEINFVERGRATYLFGGRILSLPVGRLLLFWGATPHRIIYYSKDTLHHWLEIPLATFLQWRLAERMVARLMAGELVVEPSPARQQQDCAAFHGWHQDLESKSPRRQHIVALEVEARLRRLELSIPAIARPAATQAVAAHQRMERMATYVAAHYTEPIRLAQVAREAHLRPDYATTLFKKVSGLSVMDYVTQHRLSHAKRLLLTTDDKVLEVALQAGFGSSSRFYEAFTQWCGQTPRQYRKMSRVRRD